MSMPLWGINLPRSQHSSAHWKKPQWGLPPSPRSGFHPTSSAAFPPSSLYLAWCPGSPSCSILSLWSPSLCAQKDGRDWVSQKERAAPSVSGEGTQSLMDGLQPGVLCPYTSLFTFTMPMCMHRGTTWTSHTRPDVGWLGADGPGPRRPCPPSPQQQCGVPRQAASTCGRGALAEEAYHQPVQV